MEALTLRPSHHSTMEESNLMQRRTQRQQDPEIRSGVSLVEAQSQSPSILASPYLRQIASWIRDDLDPLVAREGSSALGPDDVLTIHSVLIAMQTYNVPIKTLRESRIHLAVTSMCGKATRWPKKLANEADSVVKHWDRVFGRTVKGIRLPLFEPGGRLWEVCEPSDMTRESMMQRFISANQKIAEDSWARKHGPLGFTAGQWWINAMFAYREGIITEDCTNGGIVASTDGAYAIVMKSNEETRATSFHSFTYSSRQSDQGRYRLTSANYGARQPVRVLRCHDLKSPWAPSVGIRYDGLHKVTGWTCRSVSNTTFEDGIRFQYDVHLEYADQISVPDILRHPLAEERDDFAEYQTVCQEERNFEQEGAEILAHRPARRGLRWSSLHGQMSDPLQLLQRKGSGMRHSTMSTPDHNKSVAKRAARMNILNIKKDIEQANVLAGFGPGSSPQIDEEFNEELEDSPASLGKMPMLTRHTSRGSRTKRSSDESISETIIIERSRSDLDFVAAFAGPIRRNMLLKMPPFTGNQSYPPYRPQPQTPNAARRALTRSMDWSMDGSEESDVSPFTLPTARPRLQDKQDSAVKMEEAAHNKVEDVSPYDLTETDPESPELEKRLAEARRNALSLLQSPVGRVTFSGRPLSQPVASTQSNPVASTSRINGLIVDGQANDPRRDSGHQNLSEAGRLAAARGAFEVARSKEALAENAEEFLLALQAVWHELGEVDYVDRQVLKL